MIYLIGIIAGLAVIWLVAAFVILLASLGLNWIDEHEREMREWEDWGDK